jgi:hypothetical protein
MTAVVSMADPRTCPQDHRSRCRIPGDADEQWLPERGHAGRCAAGQHVPQPAVDHPRGSLELDDAFLGRGRLWAVWLSQCCGRSRLDVVEDVVRKYMFYTCLHFLGIMPNMGLLRVRLMVLTLQPWQTLSRNHAEYGHACNGQSQRLDKSFYSRSGNFDNFSKVPVPHECRSAVHRKL